MVNHLYEFITEMDIVRIDINHINVGGREGRGIAITDVYIMYKRIDLNCKLALRNTVI